MGKIEIILHLAEDGSLKIDKIVKKACTYCYKNKKRCDRKKDNEECKNCLKRNIECVNREHLKVGRKSNESKFGIKKTTIK